MRYADLILMDTVNGPGFRVSLFVSGCTLNCPGCFNKPAQHFKHGDLYTAEVEQRILDALKDEYVMGLSILGGDPLENRNVSEVISLCKRVKRLYETKDIWLWTGRTLEEILESQELFPILEYIDVLVEGRFVEVLKDPQLPYSGSSNQRVINVRALNSAHYI